MRRFIVSVLTIVTLSFYGFEVRSQDANAEANKLFVEAVTLYRQSQSSSGNDKTEAYTKVRVLFDQLLKSFPNSKPAKIIAEGGSPGGVDLTSLPASTPDGWNDAKRAIVRDLLSAYDGDGERLSTVASSLEWAILACAAYADDGAMCTDDITGLPDVQTSELGWVPSDPIVANYLGVGRVVAYRYQNNDGRVALVFRGSDEFGDFMTNILGTADPSFLNAAQLSFAAKLADEIVAKHPNTTFVGHSLGGRLAQIGALSTGRPAIAFNSAPLGSWETIRYAQNLNRRSELVTRLRGPDDPVSVLGAQKPSDQVEVSNMARTGDGLIKNLAGAALQGYSHSMSPLVGAMQEVHNAQSLGWIAAYLNEQADSEVEDSAPTVEAVNQETLMDTAPLLAGIYVNDPILCQSPAETPEIWERIIHIKNQRYMRRGTICSLRSATIQDGDTEFQGSCDGEGEVSDVSWTWNIEADERFVEPLGGRRDVWMRCSSNSPLVQFYADNPEVAAQFYADETEERSKPRSVQVAGQTCRPADSPVSRDTLLTWASKPISGRTASGADWSLDLWNLTTNKVGPAVFTNSKGEKTTGLWKPLEGEICQSYNKGESWACHSVFPCTDGDEEVQVMQNSDGIYTSIIQVRGRIGATQAAQTQEGGDLGGIPAPTKKMQCDAEWFTTKPANCRACVVKPDGWLRYMQKTENISVSWNGACKDGVIEGPGQLTWHSGIDAFTHQAKWVFETILINY